MKRTAPLLASLSGLLALVLISTTQASHPSGEVEVLSAQQQALCAAPVGPVPAFRHLPGHGATLRVVAMGSSSTYGAGASVRSRSFVSQFRGALKTVWAGPSEVINRGVSGNVLKNFIERAPHDIYALKPDVVILQTGTNDVLHNVPVNVYRQQLQGLVNELLKRHIEVVLVDNQFLPAQVNSAEYLGIQEATHAVAQHNHLPLVSRYGLSETLQTLSHVAASDLIARDGLHPNDAMHTCTAKALSATFARAMQATPQSSS
ncbi:SGNH/GDSL hydrolase family protein [Deinococcus sp.]|uniref:SGNH/GDSL hydrolase family protein n=1 Tax=Deinococcus sp. TaxID=47478 RepID=UPI003CC6912C